MMFTIALAAISIVACKKESPKKKPDAKETSYQISANIESSVLKTGSVAKGDISGLYSPVSRKLVYMINYKDITPTSIQFRNEKNEVVAEVQKVSGKFSPPLKGELTLSTDNANRLLSQKLEVVLFSEKFPNGEIKGKISAKKQ